MLTTEAEAPAIRRFNQIGEVIVQAYRDRSYARMTVEDLQDLLEGFLQAGRIAGLSDNVIRDSLAEAIRGVDQCF